MPHFTDPDLQDILDDAQVALPDGEPPPEVEAVVKALMARASEPELQTAVADAAEALWDAAARERVAQALDGRNAAAELRDDLDLPTAENPFALALAYHLALPALARHASLKEWLAELEPRVAELDADDRERFGPMLARVATPALAVDVELMKDEGYRYVATFPPEGSEGVDVVGKAASWLTRRLTVDGDAPRFAMRRFLALLAAEAEPELPTVAEVLGRLVAEPMPPAPVADRPFLALARGLVEEAVAERGPPY